MQTLRKNKQEVKYWRQTDGSLKLQLLLITLKPLKSEAPPPTSLANSEGRETIFQVSDTVSEFLIVHLDLCFLLAFPGFIALGEKSWWVTCAGDHLQETVFPRKTASCPACRESPAFLRGRAAPCLKHWKQEQIWQRSDSGEQPEKTR